VYCPYVEVTPSPAPMYSALSPCAPQPGPSWLPGSTPTRFQEALSGDRHSSILELPVRKPDTDSLHFTFAQVELALEHIVLELCIIRASKRYLPPPTYINALYSRISMRECVLRPSMRFMCATPFILLTTPNSFIRPSESQSR